MLQLVSTGVRRMVLLAAIAAPWPAAAADPCTCGHVHGHTACACGCAHAHGGTRLQAARTEFRAHMQATVWGYPDLFCEPPFGMGVRSTLRNQIEAGLADRMTLYHFDFQLVGTDHPEQLTPRGNYQLAKIAPMTGMVPAVVRVEPTGDAQLDQRRRTVVLERLAALGYQLPEESVVTGRPELPGLPGDEAVLVYNRLIQGGASPPADAAVPAGDGSASPTPAAPTPAR